jgi:hypothetical protein
MSKKSSGKTSKELMDFFRDVFEFGVDETQRRLGWSDEEIAEIFESQGLSEQQIQILTESQEFRDGLKVGEGLPLPPEIQSTLQDIQNIQTRLNDDIIAQGGATNETREVIDRGTEIGRGELPTQQDRVNKANEIFRDDGRTNETNLIFDRADQILNSFGRVGMNEAVDAIRTASDIVATGGVTPKTSELFELGTGLVKSRGFGPEMTDAFNTILTFLDSPGSTTPEFRETFDALKNIVQSEGAQGAGILPLQQVVGLAQASAGERSAQLAQAAQREATRRGLSPGAVTTGTDVFSESSAMALKAEGDATAQAVQSNQALKVQATSDALRNMTALVASQQNDPRIGYFAGTLGDIIRSSAMNIQTGAGMATNAAALENERLATGFSAIRDISTLFSEREAFARGDLLTANRQNLERLAFGADLLAQNTQERLQGQELILRAGEFEQQNLFRAFENSINADIAQSNIFNNTQGRVHNEFLQGLGLSADISQAGQSNVLGAIGLNNQAAIPFLNVANSAQSLFGDTGNTRAQIQAQPGFLQQLAMTGVGALAGAAGGAMPLPSSTPRFSMPSGSATLQPNPALRDFGIPAPSINQPFSPAIDFRQF